MTGGDAHAAGDQDAALTESLAAALAELWALLLRGAADRHAAARTLTLATVGRDGAPSLRTVVLRRCAPGERLLEIHTDARSAKIAELAAEPRAALHVWEPGRRVQLRLACEIAVHRGDERAAAAWRRVPPASRDVYRMMPAPGTPIGAPEAAAPPGGSGANEDASASGGNFAVLEARVTNLEYLHIDDERHRRAAFVWNGATWRGAWLAP